MSVRKKKNAQKKKMHRNDRKKNAQKPRKKKMHRNFFSLKNAGKGKKKMSTIVSE